MGRGHMHSAAESPQEGLRQAAPHRALHKTGLWNRVGVRLRCRVRARAWAWARARVRVRVRGGSYHIGVTRITDTTAESASRACP